MSAATCDECAGWIDASNLRWPGYCSPDCRDTDRARRDAVASDRARRRADAQQQHRATEARRRPHYLT